MKARHVIHTVGPVWHGGGQNEDTLLADAYRNSISIAEENGLRGIAFPAISTGVYGFPGDRAAGIVASLLKKYFAEKPKLDEIHLVFFSRWAADAFLSVAEPILQ
jgi:O-acetyl-ADP-ribose deacetylase (regulator of RNase III)